MIAVHVMDSFIPFNGRIVSIDPNTTLEDAFRHAGTEIQILCVTHLNRVDEIVFEYFLTRLRSTEAQKAIVLATIDKKSVIPDWVKKYV